MRRFARLALVIPVLIFSVGAAGAQERFEDVVRNLRNPDPKIRFAAVRLLREAGYAEAIAPIAPLVADQINEIQLEAIGAELSFYLMEPVSSKRRVALVVEVRADGRALAAFEAGPLAAWPKPVPPELVDALLQAVDDENGKVRVEAIYALGVIARGPLPDAQAARLVKALDHYDPAIRTGAARVIGRLKVTTAGEALLKAVNDSNPDVRYAAIRALGEIDDARAVQAITEQLTFYQKGEGAYSALDALARIAHPSSVPTFQARLTDRDPYLRRAAAEGLARAGDAASIAAFETTANLDQEEMVRLAMAFALFKQGHAIFLGRLIDALDSDRLAPQIQGYLVELGPTIVPAVTPRLLDPEQGVRRHLATVLGALGDESTIAALTPLKEDRDRDVAAAASRAIERIKMTPK